MFACAETVRSHLDGGAVSAEIAMFNLGMLVGLATRILQENENLKKNAQET